MKFQDIFEEEGLYKADGFKDGVCFKVDSEGILKLLIYIDKNDIKPSSNRALVYRELFYKDYTKVLNINQLFK